CNTPPFNRCRPLHTCFRATTIGVTLTAGIGPVSTCCFTPLKETAHVTNHDLLPRGDFRRICAHRRIGGRQREGRPLSRLVEAGRGYPRETGRGNRQEERYGLERDDDDLVD